MIISSQNAPFIREFMSLDCTGVLSLQPSGRLDPPALLRSTAGASRHPRLNSSKFPRLFPSENGRDGKGPAIGWSILLCDCRFPTTPSHFLRDKTLGTRLLETGPITVKPLLSRHPRDLPKCPLNRGCLSNWGL